MHTKSEKIKRLDHKHKKKKKLVQESAEAHLDWKFLSTDPELELLY